MARQPYSLRFQPALIMRPGNHARCELHDSIAEHISLIIATDLYEFRYDPEFGCRIWEQDFVSPASLSKWRDDIANSIKASVLKFETRLKTIDIKVAVDEQLVRQEKGKTAVSRLKRRIVVTVAGQLAKTDESFRFTETIFFSPISWD